VHTVVAVCALEPFRVWVRFADRTEGVADLSDLFARGGVFAPLKDAGELNRVRRVPSFGTIEWPGGVDLDPDSLYQRSRERGQRRRTSGKQRRGQRSEEEEGGEGRSQRSEGEGREGGKRVETGRGVILSAAKDLDAAPRTASPEPRDASLRSA